MNNIMLDLKREKRFQCFLHAIRNVFVGVVCAARMLVGSISFMLWERLNMCACKAVEDENKKSSIDKAHFLIYKRYVSAEKESQVIVHKLSRMCIGPKI